MLCSYLGDCGQLVIFIKGRATHLRAISLVCIIYFLIYPLPCSLSLKTTINKTFHAEHCGLYSQKYIFRPFLCKCHRRFFLTKNVPILYLIHSFYIYFQINYSISYMTGFSWAPHRDFVTYAAIFFCSLAQLEEQLKKRIEGSDIKTIVLHQLSCFLKIYIIHYYSIRKKKQKYNKLLKVSQNHIRC